MRLPETRDLFAREFEFPVERATVIEGVGDVDLEAPNGESESVGDVIERSGVDEFDSPDELYDALITSVGDAFIGRKFYDDRGSQAGIDSEEVSF